VRAMAHRRFAPLRPVLLVGIALIGAASPCCQDAPQAAPNPTMQSPKKPNRLQDSTSPYLRQHAHNPVDWHPWGPEALTKSKQSGKPIFLSVGYSSCHWCHVMERESFMDEAVAALLNEHFVCVKVDREERPDLDEIYMAAVQAMTGSGGWPMSVWLTPDLEPFYGGTYFPPEDRNGLPSFARVVRQLAKVWSERRADCEKGGKQLTEHLRSALKATGGADELPRGVAASMVEQSKERYDEQHGGFAQAPHFAPKFPHASELHVLLLQATRGDAAARTMADTTLDRMAAGGMFDQLGFGFHRYSTDREWLVPHFEKMLYDNALLAGVYVDASLLPGGERHRDVARWALDAMLSDLRGPEGAFWSSHDADSEGMEGKFFVWSDAEWRAVLGDDAALAAARWGVTDSGNWEGTNVLHVAASHEQLAARFGVTVVEVASKLERCRVALLAARNRRARPATDDKVLAAWNGMAIAALARAWHVLGDAEHLEAAQRAAAFVLDRMTVDGRLLRSWRDGRGQGPSFVEDYGFVADALITLFEADADPRWLSAARDLLRVAVSRYGDEQGGGFFFTSDDHEALLARSGNVTESSIPSGASMVALSLLRCGLLLGDEAMHARGVRAVRAHASLLEKAPIAAPTLVYACEFAQADPREIVVSGPPDDPRTRALLLAARRAFPRFSAVGLVHDGNREALEALSPLFVGKQPIDGVPAAYVCRRGACEKPVTDPEDLRP
jgi:uncharacterized protein